MQVLLYQDATVNLDLDTLTADLRRVAPGLGVTRGRVLFELPAPSVSNPESYQRLSAPLVNETAAADLAVLVTRKPYDNNYFFQASGSRVILSLFGWKDLTDLPIENGVVYFMSSLILDELGFQFHHEENTGCINDFWWDKRGVDAGMRAAYLCHACYTRVADHLPPEALDRYKEVEVVLDHLSRASRRSTSVLTFWADQRRQGGTQFDAFLCHNSADKPAVRELAGRLRGIGLVPWLDEEELRPGLPWQDQLQAQIDSIASALVCLGPSGMGPWQNMELRGFLTEFMERRCPVIPVLLAGADTIPALPPFLREFTWVDFRQTVPDPLSMLRWGITGVRDHDPTVTHA
jgi:TIR domain